MKIFNIRIIFLSCMIIFCHFHLHGLKHDKCLLSFFHHKSHDTLAVLSHLDHPEDWIDKNNNDNSKIKISFDRLKNLSSRIFGEIDFDIVKKFLKDSQNPSAAIEISKLFSYMLHILERIEECHTFLRKSKGFFIKRMLKKLVLFYTNWQFLKKQKKCFRFLSELKKQSSSQNIPLKQIKKFKVIFQNFDSKSHERLKNISSLLAESDQPFQFLHKFDDDVNALSYFPINFQKIREKKKKEEKIKKRMEKGKREEIGDTTIILRYDLGRNILKRGNNYFEQAIRGGHVRLTKNKTIIKRVALEYIHPNFIKIMKMNHSGIYKILSWYSDGIDLYYETPFYPNEIAKVLPSLKESLQAESSPRKISFQLICSVFFLLKNGIMPVDLHFGNIRCDKFNNPIIIDLDDSCIEAHKDFRFYYNIFFKICKYDRYLYEDSELQNIITQKFQSFFEDVFFENSQKKAMEALINLFENLINDPIFRETRKNPQVKKYLLDLQSQEIIDNNDITPSDYKKLEDFIKNKENKDLSSIYPIRFATNNAKICYESAYVNPAPVFDHGKKSMIFVCYFLKNQKDNAQEDSLEILKMFQKKKYQGFAKIESFTLSDNPKVLGSENLPLSEWNDEVAKAIYYRSDYYQQLPGQLRSKDGCVLFNPDNKVFGFDAFLWTTLYRFNYQKHGEKFLFQILTALSFLYQNGMVVHLDYFFKECLFMDSKGNIIVNHILRSAMLRKNSVSDEQEYRAISLDYLKKNLTIFFPSIPSVLMSKIEKNFKKFPSLELVFSEILKDPYFNMVRNDPYNLTLIEQLPSKKEFLTETQITYFQSAA